MVAVEKLSDALHLFVKFNEENEDFPKIKSTIREHEQIGVAENSFIWGQFTTREKQIGISSKYKKILEQQIENGIPTFVFFYSRKAQLLYVANLKAIYDRDASELKEKLHLIPSYYQYRVGKTHLTSKVKAIIYSYFEVSDLKAIDLDSQVVNIYHSEKEVPVLDIKGMQALLYVKIHESLNAKLDSRGYRADTVTFNNPNELNIEEKILQRVERKKRNKTTTNFSKSSKNPPKGTKRNYIEEAKLKSEIGLRGELLVIKYEKDNLITQGRADLADDVYHVSNKDGDGLGYDILSFESNGDEKYIEVKTTIGSIDCEFFIEEAEVAFSRDNAEKYYLYRVYGINTSNPKLYIQQGSIEDNYDLKAKTYIAR